MLIMTENMCICQKVYMISHFQNEIIPWSQKYCKVNISVIFICIYYNCKFSFSYKLVNVRVSQNTKKIRQMKQKISWQKMILEETNYIKCSTAIHTCFLKTSFCTSGSEKFLLKSRPHSPIATHSGLDAIFFKSCHSSSSYDLAS